jgi:hypothetical protein
VKFGPAPEHLVEHRCHGIKNLTGVPYTDPRTVRLGAMTARLWESMIDHGLAALASFCWCAQIGAFEREPARYLTHRNRQCLRTIATRNDDGRDATSKPSGGGGGVAAADPSPELPSPVHAAGPIALRSQGWAAFSLRRDQAQSASPAQAR